MPRTKTSQDVNIIKKTRCIELFKIFSSKESNQKLNKGNNSILSILLIHMNQNYSRDIISQKNMRIILICYYSFYFHYKQQGLLGRTPPKRKNGFT